MWQKKEELKIGCAGVPEQATSIQFSSECLLRPPIAVIIILKKIWMLLKSFEKKENWKPILAILQISWVSSRIKEMFAMPEKEIVWQDYFASYSEEAYWSPYLYLFIYDLAFKVLR